MFNVVALRGRLSRPAELRVLPAGDTLVGLEVSVKRADSERADTIPVVWHGAPASAAALEAGEEVVVIGHVNRRFFRAAGATQSRTEVVASAVIPARSAKRAESALRGAATALEAALDAIVARKRR